MIKQELKKLEAMTLEQAKSIDNINVIPSNDRWNLYRLWVKLYTEHFEKEIKIYRNKYKSEWSIYNSFRKTEDIKIVQNAKIIGIDISLMEQNRK